MEPLGPIEEALDPEALEQFRNSLVLSLKETSRLIEDIYLRMGNTYPGLIEELDGNLGMAEGVRVARQGLVRSADEALHSIRDRETVAVASQRTSQTFLSTLDLEVVQLRVLESGIAEIREDSVLMELLSLNAMVIAVKAGAPGRAFSCISDELQRTSVQTRELMARVEHGERGLLGSFEDFKASLETLNQDETSGISKFLESVRDVFGGLSRESQELLDRLERLRERTAEVKGPLVSIMVDIQNQDRIRQSLDHVISALGQMVWDGTDALESQLNSVSYLEALAELCVRVLAEIHGQIDQNQRSFSGYLDAAALAIRSIQDQRLELAGSASGGFGLGRWIDQGLISFAAFDDHANRLSRQQDDTLHRSDILRRSAKLLVDSLRAFDTILSRYRSMDLAARIQIARHDALSSMKGNASEMNSLTFRMEQHMGQCIEVTGGFFAAVEGTFEAFRTESLALGEQERAFRVKMAEALAKLKESAQTLGQALAQTSVFSETFLRQFAQTAEELNVLQRLRMDIEEKQRALADLKAQVTGVKRQLLAQGGLSEWRLPEGRLETLVQRFTIFSHKTYAAELGKFSIDSSGDPGDVTLF